MVDTLDAAGTSFGIVTLRPLMGGVTWSKTLRPRWSVELTGVAGYSLNGFDPSEDGDPGDGPRLVLPSSVASIDNSFVWEVSAKLWYDVHPRVAVTTGLSYLDTRPRLTLGDGSQRAWNGARLGIEGGLAFRLFGRR